MSKRYCVLLLLIPFMLVAGQIEKGVSYSIEDLQFSEHEGYDVVRLKHCAPTAQLGEPELAVEQLLVLIPPHATVENIEVVSSRKVHVEGTYKILPTQHPEPFMIHEPFPFAEPDPQIYSMTSEYPGIAAEITHVGTKGGYRIVTITLHPLQYVPDKQQLFLYTNIRIKLQYEEHQISPEPVWREDHAYQKEAVKRLVVNPEQVDAWSPQVRDCSRTQVPGTKGPTFENPEYAIMVADGFESYFEPLRNWRNKKGIPTEIFLRDWILSNYAGTADYEKVRNFIIDYHQNHGTVYFLCVGDWGDFPMNRIPTSDDPNTPTDFWYQDYDDDHYSEVYVGRASISDSTEAQTFVNKVLMYEREPPATGFYEKIFLPGYELWSGYGNPECDTIAAYDPPSWLDAKRYSYLLYLPTSEINDTFNVGYGYAEISAHGSWNGWGSPGHNNADADGLTNAPPRCGVCTAICCLIAELDYASGDSYVEHMMNNPNGGTTAFWGNTRSGYGRIENTGRSEWLDIWFYDELNNNGVYIIGQTCAASKDRAVPYVGDSYVYHCMHCLNLFGDPAMQLWTTYPDVLLVTHPGDVPVGGSTFDVTVTSDGSPVSNALVCVMCDQDVMYDVGYTNAQGDVSFAIYPQIVGDTMWVTVTKPNYQAYEGGVPVVSSTYPYVMYIRNILDDASGGNSDGIVNPGETIDFGIWAKNVGTGTALEIYGLLSDSDAYVTLTIDSSWYGDIPEDDSVLSNPYYQFDVANGCPDGHKIDFTLNFHDSSDSIFTSYPSVTVYAPLLAFVDVAVVNDDNSNGLIDPDETADLVVTIENEGGAVAENVTSTLTTDSPYITITDGSGDYGSIEPDSTADNAADVYTVYASDGTPSGSIAEFEIEVVSGLYVDTLQFSIVVGQKQYYVWNPDPTPTPGQNVHTVLTNLGYVGDYGTSLPDLNLYQSVFVCLGIYSSNHVILAGSPEATALVDYINGGGKCYMEGGDVWYWDPSNASGYDFGPLFGINPVSDGTSDLGPVLGDSGRFTAGMDFAYGGENNYIDHLAATGTGFNILRDGDNGYICGVANDAGTYRTVGTSFELGLLTDATPPSTRAALLDSIMIFFGIGSQEQVIPPSAPSITQAMESGADVQLTWNTVTTDTTGSPETMDCYVVYRDTSPDFVPTPGDSIGAVVHPDTTYTDAGAVLAATSYYYLVKAVDTEGHASSKSNMACKFNKSFNENPATTDKNWTSLPWDNAYSTVSELANDLSLAGDPLTKITNLRDDQNYESWLWDDIFLEWNGTDFAIVPGCAYEMTASNDTVLTITGCNDPDGLISLNENPATADKNWVSLPYNASYATVSDITDEYSVAGDPLTKLTTLRDDQYYESWLWDDLFMMWNGVDFAIESGRGYEMVTTTDTTWNPTEHSNSLGSDRQQSVTTTTESTISLGTLREPVRAPQWHMANGTWQMAKSEEHMADGISPIANSNKILQKAESQSPMPNAQSLVVRAYVDVTDLDDLVFTVYRADEPSDVITERTIGSGVFRKGNRAVLWFDAGNYQMPWSDGDELIMIIEATDKGAGQYAVLSFALDATVDIQELGDRALERIPQPCVLTQAISSVLDNPDVIGYSVYQEGTRFNTTVLTADDRGIPDDVSVKLVIRGGYETVYGSQGAQSGSQKQLPVAYAFGIAPNPFTNRTGIAYALPRATSVNITIYDVNGRQIKTCVSGKCEPGYYRTEWYGDDNSGGTVAAGVYFVRFETGEYKKIEKAILLR